MQQTNADPITSSQNQTSIQHGVQADLIACRFGKTMPEQAAIGGVDDAREPAERVYGS